MRMTDLVYFGYEWEPECRLLEKEFVSSVKERFPDIRLEDAYDSIKGYRQAVYTDNETEESYLVWALCHGWASCSMTLSLLFFEDWEKIERLLETGRKEYPECFKKKVI